MQPARIHSQSELPVPRLRFEMGFQRSASAYAGILPQQKTSQVGDGSITPAQAYLQRKQPLAACPHLSRKLQVAYILQRDSRPHRSRLQMDGPPPRPFPVHPPIDTDQRKRQLVEAVLEINTSVVNFQPFDRGRVFCRTAV